jgi:hypothetical protein
MVTSTIILDGNVAVEGISFRWWVRDASEPLLTVSHHKFGTETAPLGDTEPAAQARAIAKKMLAALKTGRTSAGR